MKTQLLLLLTFTISILQAQDLPTTTPPSPEAASLGKFNEIPISHYTGVPNISIPITAFKVGNKTFPISIDYHARGLQVAEIASRVGLGWALNAGGQIARQIRFGADEESQWGYFNHYGSIYTLDRDQFIDDLSSTPPPFSSTIEYDKLPDIFSLQLGSLSSKFIFNYDNSEFKPLLQKYDDIIIETIGDFLFQSSFSGFKVTDKEGYKYTFFSDTSLSGFIDSELVVSKFVFKPNGSYDQTDPDGTTPTNNTWRLTEIESPNGDRASFHYHQETSRIYRRSYDKQYIINENLPLVSGVLNGQYLNYSDLALTTQHQLSEIRYNYDTKGDYAKIEFIAGELREDLKNIMASEAKELSAINIYEQSYINTVGTPVFTLKKSFNLHHTYMQSPSSGNYIEELATMDFGAAKRLVLDSVTEIGKDGIEKPPFVFSYNEQPLPNRHSNAQDYWGYYNAKNNGRFLKLLNSNRTVDTLKSEAGMLKKITYPTGGSTRFTYEHNRGYLGDEHNNIHLPRINPSYSNPMTVSTIDSSNYEIGGIYGGGVYKSDVYPVNTRSSYNLSYFLPFWGGVNQVNACSSTPTSDCAFRVKLVRLDGNNNPILGGEILLWADSTPVWLDPGRYQIELHLPNGWNPSAVSPFLISLIGEDATVNQDTLLYAAGKRIKQIEFLDQTDNVVSQKTYDYKDSGIILGISEFVYIASEGNSFGNLDTYSGHYAPRPGALFSTYQGNTIGYRLVNEYYGDKNHNFGMTSYLFSVPKDGGDYITRPPTPPIDNEWLRGLPLKITDFKHNIDGSYSKLKQIVNNYLVFNEGYENVLPSNLNYEGGGAPTFQASSSIFFPNTLIYEVDNLPLIYPTNMTYQKTRTHFSLPMVWRFILANNVVNQVEYQNKIKIFHFVGGSLDTSETKETLFDAYENPTLETITTNAFDYQKHYQTKGGTTVNSDGVPTIQYYNYAQDLVSGYAIHPDTYSQNPITALAEQHRFIPLETKISKGLDNEETLSRTVTQFDWFPTNAQDILEPKYVLTSKSNDLIEERRIEFIKYDENSNILEVSKTDGTHIVYIWGYGDTQPIAKIENATYAQVLSHVPNLQTKSNTDTHRSVDTIAENGVKIYANDSEGNLREALDGLRDTLPNALVTTYTYDPLIGVTSMTDPRGSSVYYDYDGFNRLKHVKDQDGNILSKSDYKYRPQN